MAVQEFVLVPTRGDSVAIQGRMIAHAEGPADNPKLFGRRHTITVYESVNGFLFVKIEFLTQSPHEQDVTVVETNVLLDDLDDLLMTYEATEFLNDRHLTEMHSTNAANRFKKDLWREYDSLTVLIQQQVTGFAAKRQDPAGELEGPAKASSSRMMSWIPFRSHS